MLRHRVVGFLRSSVWLVPLGSMCLALLLLPLLRHLDHRFSPTGLGFGPDGAHNVLTMIAASMLSLLVFAFSALLITVQLASAQLTPRMIAGMLIRGRPVKFTIGLVVLTYTLSVGVLGRTETSVLQVSTAACVALSLASIAVFLYLMDLWIKALRPVSVMASVGAEALRVIEDVYPCLLRDTPVRKQARIPPSNAATARRLLHPGPSGVLIAADFDGLARKAHVTGGLIEILPLVGDYVASGEPLLITHGGANLIEARRLYRALLFGAERTLQQDPMFAFRILVDIAIKALSPAINDPTTAVLALDQLHRLLLRIGERCLDTPAVLDASGQNGLIFRTPDWDDYVALAISEIRSYGAGSLLVVQRLKGMLNSLAGALPVSRRDALRTQLDLLDRAALRHFQDPEDLALMGVAAASPDLREARLRQTGD